MKQISLQSKSFIILATIAVIGTLLSIAYSYFSYRDNNSNTVKVINYPKPQGTASQDKKSPEPTPAVDTSAWKEYTDNEYGLSFKYNPDWKLRPSRTRSGWYVLQLDPGPKYDNMKIFVSDKSYFAMEGLPMQEEDIGTTKAVSVLDMLYGIKSNKYYYTFDLGASVSLQPQFQALVSSVTLLD